MPTLYLRNLRNPGSIKIRRSISGGREMPENKCGSGVA